MLLTALRILLALLVCATAAGCVMVLMGATTGVGHVTGAVLFLATCVLLSAVAVVEAVLSVRRAVEAGRRVPKSDG